MPVSKNSFESDSCAVGGAFNPMGGNIALVLEFLKKLPHRGGQIFTQYKGQVIKVGDGAGVNCTIDRNYYNHLPQLAGAKYENYGIGNFFLPVGAEAREKARQNIQEICARHKVNIIGNQWREIPFDSDDTSEAKELKLQKFEQAFLEPQDPSISKDEFERVLGLIHREIEEYSHQLNTEYQASGAPLPKLAVASLSCKKVIYKGMLLPDEVANFRDLQLSNPSEVVYHIRQSTNVSPSPGNAQPFMIIAHNGELNSSEGNADKDHRAPRGFSDSRTFDENLRELLLSGKSITEALTTLMPPPKTGDARIDAMIDDMRISGAEYNGPAHMVFHVGNIQGAKLDSSALRPSRYLVATNSAGQNCLYVGSEDMFSEERLAAMGLTVTETGMLGAGEMIIIEDNVVKKNAQILSELAASYTSSRTTPVVSLADLRVAPTLPTARLEIGQRELEIRKYQMLPLLEGATKKIAMGDDTSPMKDEDGNLNIADHFKQLFSQVSSPPLDSDKEPNSFSLVSYLGNKENQAAPVLRIHSPILKVGELEAIEASTQAGCHKVDLSVDLSAMSAADRGDERQILDFLRGRISQICTEVEGQVRAGKSIIILDGSKTSKTKMGLPDILVTAAVHSHLHEKGLEKQASLIVNSAQMESAHHFSVLSALGATAVSPAAGYDLAAELATTKEDPQAAYRQYCDNFQHAVEKAHLVTMGKYGINSAQVYCGSRLIETMTLNLQETSADHDPSCLGKAFRSVKCLSGFNGRFGVDDLLTNALQDHHRRHGHQITNSGYFAYTPSGVSHSYNPAVIGAIRGITTSYRTKRSLVEHYSATADKLEAAKTSIPADFDPAAHQAALNRARAVKIKARKGIERQITQCDIKSDKLTNSLFFISGITRALEDVASRQKSSGDMEDLIPGQPKFSLNDAQIRQFLSIKSGVETETSLTRALQLYKAKEIDSTEFKKVLFAKAGYDATDGEVEKVEQWASLLLEGKLTEAAGVFRTLSPTNQTKVGEFEQEHQAIQEETSQLRLQLAAQNHAVEDILIDIGQKPAAASRAGYLSELDLEIAELRTKATQNNLLPPVTADGSFDVASMDDHQIDEAFSQGMARITTDKANHPVTIADHLQVRLPEAVTTTSAAPLQTVSDIAANHFVTGGMSHGALTLSAHQDVAKAARLIGSRSCTGEGGKPEGQKARMVQIASGRFGIDPEYFTDADTVEIKVVQGAKPGEGGMLPDGKMSVEIAAIRRAIPGFGLISPPPHHDIYSIEDLQELIHDLKEFKPGINVAVKLCASSGIDQIAIGVAKSGADIINIASGSGGTGAAAIDSIKSTGLPSEIGLVAVHQALSKAGIRPLVKLQTSGFPNTPEGVIMMAILGGDILESGTTDVMLLGCDMHRKCNVPGACGPGITNNEKGYQGHAEDLALYKLNLAKAVQIKLGELGVKNLSELRGRTDLLSPENLQGKVSDDFIHALLATSLEHPQLPAQFLAEYRRNANDISNEVQYRAFESYDHAAGKRVIDVGAIDVVNRTFGATLAYRFDEQLRDKEVDHLTVKTSGPAGQSYGAFNTHGLFLEHTGSVQDGFGKSMSGGILVVKKPASQSGLEHSVYVGNAALYGASAGTAFIPSAGSRCAVLMKGATLVVNGPVGDYACEYMTSGSFVALGKVGKNFGSGMGGGIALLYNQSPELASDARYCEDGPEKEGYFKALKGLLEEDCARTGSAEAKQILDHFEEEKHKFKIVIPKNLDKIRDLEALQKVRRSFSLRKGGIENLSVFEQVWLENKELELTARAEARSAGASAAAASAATSAAESAPDYAVIEQQARLSEIALTQQDRMRQYGPVGTRIAGGLGAPDQILSDDPQQLMSELFNHGKKCSCDAVTCTSSEQRKEKTAPKHPDSGCPLAKNPNLINGVLNDSSLNEEARAKKAFMLQIQQSPYAGFTGSACPAPCQDSCTHSAADAGNSESVKIKRIELVLHRLALLKGWYDELEVFKTEPEEAHAGKKVMIVGSGPAAFEAAFNLAKRGIEVHVFEKDHEVGGLLRYGIPDHKLQKETIDFYQRKLEEMGVKFHTSTEIKIESIKETHPGFDLYLDARGIAGTPVLFDQRFAKTNVGDGGNHSLAMDFLHYCNEFFAGSASATEHPFVKFRLGENVAVLGSGDTAEDVKRSILKLNSQTDKPYEVALTTINRQPEEGERSKLGSDYPKPRETASADLEIEALADGAAIQRHNNTTPKSFELSADGIITGVRCQSTHVDEPGFARPYRGKAKTIAESVIPCSSVITALGFKAPAIHPESVMDLRSADLAAKPVIPIGDVRTKSYGDGSQLIVSAQADAKAIVDAIFGVERPSATIARREGAVLAASSLRASVAPEASLGR